MKAINTMLFSLVFLFTSSVNATLIEVDFLWAFSDRTPVNTGTFIGEDANSDAILTFGEISLLDVPGMGQYNPETNVGAYIFGFGDFNLETNVWTPNGDSWTFTGSNAYFSGTSDATSIWSCNRGAGTNNGCNVSIVSSTYNAATVPEPSTLAIFALGMIGLASRRFKKQS